MTSASAAGGDRRPCRARCAPAGPRARRQPRGDARACRPADRAGSTWPLASVTPADGDAATTHAGRRRRRRSPARAGGLERDVDLVAGDRQLDAIDRARRAGGLDDAGERLVERGVARSARPSARPGASVALASATASRPARPRRAATARTIVAIATRHRRGGRRARRRSITNASGTPHVVVGATAGARGVSHARAARRRAHGDRHVLPLDADLHVAGRRRAPTARRVGAASSRRAVAIARLLRVLDARGLPPTHAPRRARRPRRDASAPRAHLARRPRARRRTDR